MPRARKTCLVSMALLDKNKQIKLVLDFIDNNVDRIPLVKINKWARHKDIVDYMAKFGVSATTTKRILDELIEKKKIQTRWWSGRRFYAPPTIPLPFLLAVVIVMASMVIYYPITGHIMNVGDIFLILSPFYMAVAWFFLERRVNNSGICIECGKSLNNGELYCEEHAK